MKKFTAIILASLIMALPLYGCYGNSNNDDNTVESKTSVTESSTETEKDKNNKDDNKASKLDKVTYDEAKANSQFIELTIKVSMSDILAKNNELYDGVSTYTDALGMKQTVASVHDTYTTTDENGNSIEKCQISVADVAGINAINDFYKPVEYNNTEYNPYWLYDKDECVLLDSEGNSIDNISYEIDGSKVIALTKDGIPNSEVYIDTISKQFDEPIVEQVDVPHE